MILAENFIDWLMNTERDLGYRVNERYQKYLLTLPRPQTHDGDISIDGRYLVNWRNGNYLIWRTTEREQSVLTVCERTSTVMARSSPTASDIHTVTPAQKIPRRKFSV